MNNDVGVGTLGINVGDADLGVVEIELLDSVVDSLRNTQLATVDC